MEFFDGRKVAFQSKVDSHGERQNARAPIPQSVTLRAEEVAGNRRAILKQRLDLGGSGRFTAYPEVISQKCGSVRIGDPELTDKKWRITHTSCGIPFSSTINASPEPPSGAFLHFLHSSLG
jgi:hypothetical protein